MIRFSLFYKLVTMKNSYEYTYSFWIFMRRKKNNKRMRVNTPDIQAAVNIHNHNWTNYTAVADITRFKNILKTYFFRLAFDLLG